MPFAFNGSARLYWRADGFPDKPALLMLNSLGADFAMWDGVVPLLTEDFRVIRMDTRGHGASDAPSGGYSIALLAQDALQVLDASKVDTAHVCGLSLGGMIALHLAATAPARIAKVVACNTSAQMPSAPWMERAALVREKGLEAIVDMIMLRFFSEGFRAGKSAPLATARSTFLEQPKEGYAACCEAIGTMDLFGKLPAITVPLLVINGAQDVATPPAEHGARIAAAVSDARAVLLDAGHLSAIEVPSAFAGALRGFLQAI